MKSDDLVRSLVNDLQPVRRLRGPGQRALRWGVLALVCVFVGTCALGLRGDLPGKLHQRSYLLQNASLLLLFVLSALSAFRLSVPGLGQSMVTRGLPALGLLVWIGLLAFGWAHAPSAVLPWAAFWRSGVPCVARMGCLALVPGLALFFMLRRAAPVRAGWAGLWSLVSASSLAIVGTQWVCPKDDPLHVIVWHLGPVLVAGLVGIGLGRLWQRLQPASSQAW